MKLKSSTGVTFRVDDVDTVRTPLEKCKTRDSISRILTNVEQSEGPPILACSGYNSEVVANTQYHALIGAVHIAYAEHRPLVLSPDAIWITILQGLAMHVHIHAEELRSTFVSHEGRAEIKVQMDNFDFDSPESAWDVAISSFADAICDRVQGSSALLSDFSTTGVVEKLVSQVCLLDVFESYFEYILWTGCGFPEITLTGNIDDWMRLRQKIELLEPFKVDFWLPHLREIADHFCRAMRGDVDISHWQDMYKQKKCYGYDLVNGWIIKLIPYLQEQGSGCWNYLNPLLRDLGDISEDSVGASTDQLPAGISLVPLTCIDLNRGVKRKMQMLGGFVGIEQDPETFAVQPKVGWAIRKVKGSDWEILSDSTHLQHPSALSMANFSAAVQMLLTETRYSMSLPGDFLQFYKQCNGMEIHDRNGTTWNICKFEEVKRANKDQVEEGLDKVQYDPTVLGPKERPIRHPWGMWQIGDSSDGSIILLESYGHDGGKFNVLVINANWQNTLVFPGLRSFIAHLIENSVDFSEK